MVIKKHYRRVKHGSCAADLLLRPPRALPKHRHFDFRLENNGVLKSRAVPKGLPGRPNDRRLAIQIGGHGFSMIGFTGTIKEGEYGAGEVMVASAGMYRVVPWSGEKIEVGLPGQRLTGTHVRIRFRRAGEGSGSS